MASPTREQLYSHAYTCFELVSRITAATSFANGVTPTQKSGIERFHRAIDDPSSNSTPQKLVENFFNVFDDLLFGRNLRYGVTAKLEVRPSPVNTCCRGLAPGGRLIVQINDISTTSKAVLLGRLLHDMIHAFLWRHARSEFINNDLFINGWGFSGHGTAWQDIAIAIESFTNQYLIPLDLGRKEALCKELKQFTERLKPKRPSGATETTSEPTEKSAVIEPDRPGSYATRMSRGPVVDVNLVVRKPRRGSSPVRKITKRLTKPVPAHIEKTRIQTSEQAYALSAHEMGVRADLKEAAEGCITFLSIGS